MNQTREQMLFYMHFFHHEKTVGASEEICAALLGYDLAAYRGIKAEFALSVRQAARELLADPAFAQAVDHLPFAPNSVVVGLGDSITDDYISWCEILREVLALRRPDDKIQVVNAGVSGNTTSEVIARFLDVARLDPDWLIVMVGTNDARMHGLKPQKSQISSEESEKNYRALRAFGQDQTHARWCWMTPTPVISSQIAKHWFMAESQVMWLNEDLRERADILRRMPDPVVDLLAAFNPLDPAWLQEDGLHPSLAGQKVILRALVEKLAAG
jgi:acyl-CoA thioesterase I